MEEGIVGDIKSGIRMASRSRMSAETVKTGCGAILIVFYKPALLTGIDALKWFH